jgi:hypothetical protein
MAASTNKVFYMAEMSKIKSTFQKTLWMCCLSFDLWLLITTLLVSSNISFNNWYWYHHFLMFETLILKCRKKYWSWISYTYLGPYITHNVLRYPLDNPSKSMNTSGYMSLSNISSVLCLGLTLQNINSGFKLTTLVVIGSDGVGYCKSNYYMIMTTMAPCTVFFMH